MPKAPKHRALTDSSRPNEHIPVKIHEKQYYKTNDNLGSPPFLRLLAIHTHGCLTCLRWPSGDASRG